MFKRVMLCGDLTIIGFKCYTYIQIVGKRATKIIILITWIKNIYCP